LNLIGLLLLLHSAIPGARYYTQKFTDLSYHNAITGKYSLGRDDSFFVCFWIVLLSGLRAGVIDYLLIPLAGWAGIEKKKAKMRFAEQAWLICHHGSSWLCGMVS
jgi:very-long-chain ceramide synthase